MEDRIIGWAVHPAEVALNYTLSMSNYYSITSLVSFIIFTGGNWCWSAWYQDKCSVYVVVY